MVTSRNATFIEILQTAGNDAVGEMLEGDAEEGITRRRNIERAPGSTGLDPSQAEKSWPGSVCRLGNRGVYVPDTDGCVDTEPAEQYGLVGDLLAGAGDRASL